MLCLFDVLKIKTFSLIFEEIFVIMLSYQRIRVFVFTNLHLLQSPY